MGKAIAVIATQFVLWVAMICIVIHFIIKFW